MTGRKAQFCYALLPFTESGPELVEAGDVVRGVRRSIWPRRCATIRLSAEWSLARNTSRRRAGAARANFQQAGLSEFIELREGDLRETLRDIGGPVDFMLIDVWEVARPALELVAPNLRPGAIVICDNTKAFASLYRSYFEFVHDPVNRLRTITVPFKGGLELTVRI